MSERTLIVGAGAIGGVTAAHLARAGHDVTVLDAGTEHVRIMNGPGLLLDEPGGRRSRIVVPAVDAPEQLTGRFDFALVTLKSLHLAAALTPLVAGERVDTYVSFGNGLVQNTVAALVGDDRMVTGIVEWGATNHGPGHLEQTTVAPFVVGERDGTVSQRARRLAAVLAGVTEVRTSTGILGQVWSKLLVNSTFSGLGAVSGLLYGQIADDPLGRTVALRLWSEGHAVARALGIGLDTVLGIRPEELVTPEGEVTPAAAGALRVLMERAAPTKASMLQDLEKGVPTEVDVINGGVAAEAARAGVPAPLNAEIVRIVHELERGHGRPGPDAFARLAALPVQDSNQGVSLHG